MVAASKKVFMGIFVTETEIKERSSHPNNVVHHIMHDGKGRPSGVKNIPGEAKIAIGTVAKTIGPTAAAELFDCSISQASNFSKGKSVHGHGNPELKEAVEKKTDDIQTKARNLVFETLGLIGVDEIADESVRSKVSIAKDLSTVVEKLGPKGDGSSNVQINIYAPKQDNVDKYETQVIDGEVIK